MIKYFGALLLLVAVFVGGFFASKRYIFDETHGAASDYRKVTVYIDGDAVEVGTDGTKYFGNEAHNDINDDGINDTAYIITRETDGSGVFYYAVAALWMDDGTYVGTNAVFLGDRIAPQSTEIRNSIIIVNYADRANDEPFSTAPSHGVTAYLFYQDGELRGEWPTYLYVYNPTLDTDDTGTILCSEKGLVRVPRLMPEATPELAIRELLLGKLLDDERKQGMTTEFPLEGVSLASAKLEEGILTLTFDDPNNKTSGGSCRVSVLRAQIEATAQQFDDVREVQILPESVFQP